MRSCGFDWIVSLAWMCHGCGTTLASVVKMNSSIDTMQQIGSIVFPGISSIIMVNMLDIEGEVSNIRLLTFYFTPVRHILPCFFLLLSRVISVESYVTSHSSLTSPFKIPS